MQIEQTVRLAIGRLVGRFVRRAITMAVLALCVIAAFYHLTVAGMLMLQDLYGALQARLIVAGLYGALAVIIFIYLSVTRPRAPAVKARPDTARASRHAPPDVQIAMLLESILLGYASSRRKSRHS